MCRAVVSSTGIGVTLYMDANALSPRYARDEVREYLAGHPNVVDDACTCASELVTNAVQASYDTRPVELIMAERETGVYLAVRDYAAGVPMQALAPHAETRGHGLLLVAGLSDEWGWDKLSDGKIVWCSIGYGG
ncbi:MAG TPA: ATP-binding protein [Trebonia sp.]|jgi:anti-sigma regulatory factor (Ser/Thr protein kinase)